MIYADNVMELVGNTPMVKINTASKEALVLGKCEFMNPTHSVKDRIGSHMILEALREGLIDKDSVVIEPTSGNTGIALASACASLGIRLILTMPSSMSAERQHLFKAFGAQVVLTDANLGMRGAVETAQDLSRELKNSFMPQQFKNKANPHIHMMTTAQEILRDTEGKVDILVLSVGTGGSITGIGEVLKKENPDIKIVAVEPSTSAVLSGDEPGFHEIQGIGAGFVPDTLNSGIYDEIIKVQSEDAIECSRELAKKEGLLVGISSGANVFASMQIAQRPQNRGKTIVTILCDTGERYLSCGLYGP